MTERPPYASVALVSAVALAAEVLLMRMFSIVQWHHFAAMVISLALLGYGASGTFLSLLREPLLRRFREAYTVNILLFAVATAVSFPAAQRIPFHPESLLWGAGSYGTLLAIYLLLALPFFFAANAVGLALIRFGQRTGRVYASDLAGAGIGAATVVAVLFWLFPGPTLQALLAAALVALALAVWESRPLACRGAWAAVPVGAGLAGLALLPGAWFAPQPSDYKPLQQALQVPGAQVVAERSGPLGLLTVLANRQVPLRHAPGLSLRAEVSPPEQLGLYRDGEGPEPIARSGTATGAYLDQQTAAVAYHLQSPQRVLVLGAGTGTEVLRARHFGADRVEAVERNGQLVELMRGRFAAYSGHLYDRPGVRVHTAGVREFAARHPGRYDLIQVPPLAGPGGGLYAVSETYPYTVEAFLRYLAHLQPGGTLALSHWTRLPPREVLKLFATAVRALEAAGVAEPGRHLALIRGWQEATLLVKKGPLTAPEVERLRAFCRDRAFDVAYYPGIEPGEANRYNRLQRPAYYEAARALLGPEAAAFRDRYKFHIEPATDLQPYFYRFFKWSTLPEILELRGRGGTPLLESGYLTLAATLGQALLASAVLILLPLAVRRGAPTRRGLRGRTLLYFTAIGLGFLLVEIALLQRFLLFLGHPVYTAAVVLSGFLLFAGAGSAAAGALGRRFGERRALAGAVAVVVALVGLYTVVLGPLFHALAAWPAPAKAAVSVALIAPVAAAMGLPFPLALARLSQLAPALLPWAWAVNGCASVLSAILAALLALHSGLDTVLWVAAGLYLLAAAGFPRFARQGGISGPP